MNAGSTRISAGWATKVGVLAILVVYPSSAVADRARSGTTMANEAAAVESNVRGVNTYHLFTPPASRPAWEARAARLREQILFSAGLWPMPEKGPLEPRVTGRLEGADYVIENVALRTLPGFYLC